MEVYVQIRSGLDYCLEAISFLLWMVLVLDREA
jgi:hypothetical protein